MNTDLNIKSLYIEGIRNLTGIKIPIDNKLNLLIGPNGVGKSTILQTLNNIFTTFDNSEYGYIGLQGDNDIKIIIEFESLLINDDFINQFNFKSSLKLIDIQINDLYSTIIDYGVKFSNFGVIPTLAEIKAFDIEILRNKYCQIIIPISKINGKIQDIQGINPGFLICDNKIFISEKISRNNILQRYKNKVIEIGLSSTDIYEYNSFFSKYVKSVESKKKLNTAFSKFKESATQLFNSLSSSKEQSFKYTTKPQMKIEIFNKEGKGITTLSSGEKQLENLKLFLEAKKELHPKLVLLDEPEIHLNYGQLYYVSELLNQLFKDGCQVFVATHSPYFIRSSNFNYLKYIKFDQKKKPKYIQLLTETKNFLQYPDAFFAEKIIIVEGYADAIFFQRTLDVLLRERGIKDLSGKNINVVPTTGKFGIKNLVNFCRKNLGIDYFVIADLDFILEDINYNFIENVDFNKIKSNVKNIVKIDKNKTIKKFKDLNSSQIEHFLLFLNKVFKTKKIIDKEDIDGFDRFSKLFEAHYYNKSIFDQDKINKVFYSFLKNNIWLLNEGKIENYISESLKKDGKVSIDKLNEKYYPRSIKDLEVYLEKGKVKELQKMVSYIYRTTDLSTTKK